MKSGINAAVQKAHPVFVKNKRQDKIRCRMKLKWKPPHTTASSFWFCSTGLFFHIQVRLGPPIGIPKTLWLLLWDFRSCQPTNSQCSVYNKLCGRPPQYAPAPCDLDLWPFDLTCDVGYLCANFSLPRPLCSRLRPDVCDRQTDRQTSDRQTDVIEQSSLNAPAY